MRIMTRIAIGAALLVVLLLIANGFMLLQANWRLQGKRSGLRAAGQPASIADLAPKRIPDEANAAVHLERIQPRAAAFGKAHGAFYDSELGKEWSQREDAGEPPTPAQALAMRAILDAHPEILNALQRAAACDDYASRLDFSLPHSGFLKALMDGQSNLRTVARYVDWKTQLLIVDDQPDEAVKLGIQLLHVGQLYENEPTLVSYLISVAVRGAAVNALNRAIRTGPIADETRDRLLAELDIQDQPGLKNALQSEWAMVLDYPADATKGLSAAVGWPITNWTLGEADGLDAALAAANRPYYEVRHQWNPQALASNRGGGNAQQLLLPAIGAAFQAEARRVALVRSLRVLVALDAFQLRTGQEATGLADLNLPEDAVVDPHSGQPLKLKPTDAGWVIYSVMENGVDDGGDFREVKDYGVAPPGWRVED